MRHVTTLQVNFFEASVEKNVATSIPMARQNARFRGSKICASRAIRSGEEIFIPYRRSFRIGGGVVDEERSGWGIWGKRFFRDMG